MPWAPKDAPRFTKVANTAKKRRQWARVANSARAACIKKGGKPKECDASAIRQANAAVSSKKKSEGFTYTFGVPENADYVTQHCICPDCGYEGLHHKDTPCEETKCPKCHDYLIPKEQKSIPMRITKATVRSGRMYWQGAISDDDWDKDNERLSLEIFADFEQQLAIGRQKADYQPPFVSLSHYGRMDDGTGVMGTIENVWTEGVLFYAEGYFADTRLGRRVFEVVKSELQRMAAGEEIENPVRFSIAFYAHQNQHEESQNNLYKQLA